MQNLETPLNQDIDSTDKSSKHSSPSWDWYLVLGALGLLVISIFLHFWQLEKIPYPVFDESLFGQYAKEYLEGNPTWEGHPPLGKYFIMLGISLFGEREFGYRIFGASFGSILPILMVGMVYRLTYQRNVALLSGFFLLTDGLFLVESRFALLNVFLVSFGLVSQIFLLAGLGQQGKLRTFLLCCSGLMLGATASVKWNGLGFSLLLFLVVLWVWAIAKFFPKKLARLGILAEITNLHWWEYLLCFGVMPIAFYSVQWIPLFMLNSGGIEPESGFGAIHSFWLSFVRVHEHILWWHSSDVMMNIDPEHPSHPYCSPAFSWAVLARPVGYYFQDVDGYFTVVQGLGNPILWWLSTLTIVGISIASILPKLRQFANIGMTNYLLLGYFANYVPWLIVKRCIFVYHYMSSAMFSFVALAWLVCQIFTQKGLIRYLGYGIIAAVVITQIFFMPIWVGTPILSAEFYRRIWFMPDQFAGFNWI